MNRDNLDRLVLLVCLLLLPLAAYRAYYQVEPVWLTKAALAALGVAILFALGGHVGPDRE